MKRVPTTRREPTAAGCRIAPELLREFGLEPAPPVAIEGRAVA